MSVPVEIERKYVIKIPDLLLIAKCDGYTVSEIEQTYLESDPSVTHRVRRRAYKDRLVYTETKKVRIDKISSFEDEREIDESDYLSLLELTKKGTRTLTKTRHTFVFSGQTFEVDIYPEWTHSCIMETELSSREAVVIMPLFVKVVAEVTGEKAYTNASMAHQFPDELILTE